MKATINEQLQILLEQQPLYAECVKHVNSLGLAAPEFYTEYHKLQADGFIKSKILKILFQEPRLLKYKVRLNQIIFNNLLNYFIYHPKQPLKNHFANFAKDDAPYFFEDMFGISRQSMLRFFQRLFYIPNDIDSINKHPLYNAYDFSGDITAFSVHRKYGYLDINNFNYLINERISNIHNQYYFDTCYQSLNLHNALYFINHLFFLDIEDNRRIQSKIPIMISNMFGLKRLSLSEIFMALDIIGLHIDGIIDINKVNSSGDFMNLKEFANIMERDKNDRLTYLYNKLPRFRIGHDSSERILNYRLQQKVQTRNFSSSYFNVNRLLYGNKSAQLQRFKIYYEAINDDKLRQQLISWSIKQGFYIEDVLGCIKEYSGISIRDIYNSLIYTYLLEAKGLDRYTILPTVARYTLGYKENESKKVRNLPFKKRSAHCIGTRKTPMPILEKVLPE